MRINKLDITSVSVYALLVFSISAVFVVAIQPLVRAVAPAQNLGRIEDLPAQQAPVRDGAKLKTCLEHAARISKAMDQITDRGQKQLDLFGTIAARTEAFYNNKEKHLDNYNTLVAEVTTKQAIAQSALKAIKQSNANFRCEIGDPKAATVSFKDAVKNEIAALKEYKTSVKNLIKGVKSAQSTAKPQPPKNKTRGN